MPASGSPAIAPIPRPADVVDIACTAPTKKRAYKQPDREALLAGIPVLSDQCRHVRNNASECVLSVPRHTVCLRHKYRKCSAQDLRTQKHPGGLRAEGLLMRYEDGVRLRVTVLR